MLDNATTQPLPKKIRNKPKVDDTVDVQAMAFANQVHTSMNTKYTVPYFIWAYYKKVLIYTLTLSMALAQFATWKMHHWYRKSRNDMEKAN